MIKNKKIIFLAVAVVIFLIIVFLFFQRRDVKLEVDAPLLLSETEERRLFLAEETLRWIDGHRTDRLYITDCHCTDILCTECESTVEAWRNGAFFIWGRTKFYEKTLNEHDLNVINEDLNLMPTLILQIAHWHCRLLIDVWNNDSLPQETRDKARQLCEEVGYEISVHQQYSGENVDEDKFNMIHAMLNGQEAPLVDDFDSDLARESFVKQSFLVSEFLTRSNIGKPAIGEPAEFINTIKIFFLNSLYGKYFMGEDISIKDNSILGVAAVDMYNNFQDQRYLDLAKYIYDQNLEIIANKGFTSYTIAYHLFFTRLLFETTEDEKYKLGKENIISELIRTDFIDNPYRRGYHFYDYRSLDYYSTTINVLLVGILSNF